MAQAKAIKHPKYKVKSPLMALSQKAMENSFNNYSSSYEETVIAPSTWIEAAPIIVGPSNPLDISGGSFGGGFYGESWSPQQPQKESTKRHTEEEKKDDLYDCPRGCEKRMEWKDLQVHIQAGCEVKESSAKGATVAEYILAPMQTMGSTPYGTIYNPHAHNIRVTITRA